MSRKRDYAPQPNCPNCGGIHFGTRFDNCPYIKAPCVMCGTQTIFACSDCKIDTGNSVHVCEKQSCQRKHETRHVTHSGFRTDLSPHKRASEAPAEGKKR